MAKVVTNDKHYKDIAVAIRGNAPLRDIGNMKPEEMASNIGTIAQDNFFAGETAGYQVGKVEGITEGAQAERDRFWTELTTSLTIFQHTFRYWTDDMFNPNVTIKGTQFNYTFATSRLTKIGTIDASEATLFTTVFQEAYDLTTIEKLILPNNISGAVSNWSFAYCNALENISFEGEFKNNGWNFQWSTKLSHDSIVNIINALSTTTSGLSITLSKTALVAAFGNSSSEEWQALIATRPNWTVSAI